PAWAGSTTSRRSRTGWSTPGRTWRGIVAVARIPAGCMRCGPRRRPTRATTPTSCSSTPTTTARPGPLRSQSADPGLAGRARMLLTRDSETWYARPLESPAEGAPMRPGMLFTAVALAAAVVVLAPGVPGWAGAGAGGFSSEQAAGTPYLHQGNWEPTVATDPNHPDLVYQLITGINAHQCAPG